MQDFCTERNAKQIKRANLTLIPLMRAITSSWATLLHDALSTSKISSPTSTKFKAGGPITLLTEVHRLVSLKAVEKPKLVAPSFFSRNTSNSSTTIFLLAAIFDLYCESGAKVSSAQACACSSTVIRLKWVIYAGTIRLKLSHICRYNWLKIVSG